VRELAVYVREPGGVELCERERGLLGIADLAG
jgi:hypothetical protein